MDDIVAEFEWDRSEYLHVLRFGSLPWLNRYPTIGPLVMLVGLEETILGRSSDATFLYFLGLTLIVYQVFLQWFIARRVWTKLWSANPSSRVIVRDDVVTVGTGVGETSLKWIAYPRSKEWRAYYFLKHSRLLVTLIIPKRGFKSPTDEARFRHVLREHTVAKLKNDVELDPSSPFSN